MADTSAIWKKRVASWRASGQTAKAYSAGRSWSAGTLLWWSSRLRREEGAPGLEVRFARLVRSPAQVPASPHGAIVLEWPDGLRLTVGPGADHATLAAVLELVTPRSDR